MVSLLSVSCLFQVSRSLDLSVQVDGDEDTMQVEQQPLHFCYTRLYEFFIFIFTVLSVDMQMLSYHPVLSKIIRSSYLHNLFYHKEESF